MQNSERFIPNPQHVAHQAGGMIAARQAVATTRHAQAVLWHDKFASSSHGLKLLYTLALLSCLKTLCEKHFDGH